MALRDWLTRDLSGLADSPAGLATISKPLANSANLQSTDCKGEKTTISRISRISISNAPELKKQGMNRLEVAAQGLPITLDELAVIFADDLEDFGAGAVSMAGIRQACEFYARGRPQPQRDEIPVGMVRCTDCLQDRCKYRYVTPYGTVVMQSSPAWRWCDDYTARVYNLNNYRKR